MCRRHKWTYGIIVQYYFTDAQKKHIREVSMQSYVDRIYRRDDEQNIVAGIVEIVGTQEEKSFRSLEELLTILNMAEGGAIIKWEK